MLRQFHMQDGIIQRVRLSGFCLQITDEFLNPVILTMKKNLMAVPAFQQFGLVVFRQCLPLDLIQRFRRRFRKIIHNAMVKGLPQFFVTLLRILSLIPRRKAAGQSQQQHQPRDDHMSFFHGCKVMVLWFFFRLPTHELIRHIKVIAPACIQAVSRQFR